MKLSDVQTWKNFQGKKELLKHLRGEPLTLKEALLANCYSCSAGYADGRVDCKNPSCPCYGHMPYRKDKVKRTLSEKQRERMNLSGILARDSRRKTAL